jgi:hypothetical protein
MTMTPASAPVLNHPVKSPAMLLFFTVVELGRIPVPPLHLADQTEDRPIAKLLPLQSGGQIDQEGVAGVRLQRFSGTHDGSELGVGKLEWPHVGEPRSKLLKRYLTLGKSEAIPDVRKR